MNTQSPRLSAKWYVLDGMKKTEVSGDGIQLVREDGVEVEIHYARSCNEIRLSVNGALAILPVASNRVNIERSSL